MTSELDIATNVLDLATKADPGAEVEVGVDANRLALTRFANSVIHQNVADETVGIRIRVHRDGRTASGSSTRADDDGIRALVERTLAAVAVAPVDPGWPGLAEPAEVGAVAPLDPATVAVTAQDRAGIVAAFVESAAGLETAGYCRTNHWTGAFVNSAGQSVTGESANVSVDGIVRRDGADGVARIASSYLRDVDGAVLGARAAAKAAAAQDHVELPPDRYEVVLEPTAVADLLESFTLYGFNAKTVEERRSFVRVGDAQFDQAVTLVDDAPATGSAYDAEGTPHRRTVLVEGGTTVSLTHDLRTAAVAGATTTGHSVGAPAWGAIARHLTLLPAGDGVEATEVDGPIVDSSAAELVAAMERGILVTDLWYTRVLDPRTLAVTGLTRNGVWLVEGGEIAKAVRNFRFTQSYAQALMPDAVKGIGRTAQALPGDTYTAATPRWTAPALHLASWNFTGGASG